MKILLLAFLAFHAFLLNAEFFKNPDPDTLWAEDGKNIAAGKNASKEWLANDFIVRENDSKDGFVFSQVNTKNKSTGRYVPMDPAFPYLVMDIRSLEQTQGYTSFSCPVGMLQLGKLRPGYFVIDLYSMPGGEKRTFNKEFFAAFYLYNCSLDFRSIKNVRTPEHIAEMTIVGADAGRKSFTGGDKAAFSVTLKNPAKSVSIQIWNNKGMSVLDINGSPSIALAPADGGKKVWRGEVEIKTLGRQQEVKSENLMLKAAPEGEGLPEAIWSFINYNYTPDKTPPPSAVDGNARTEKAASSEKRSSAPFAGPYQLESSVFFVDHAGGDLKFDISASHPDIKIEKDMWGFVTPSLLACVYDHEEKLAGRFYWRDSENSLKKSFSHSIPGAAPGVYQVRITASAGSKMEYNLVTAPSAPRAVMPNRCWIWGNDLVNFSDAYFMVPKDTRKDLDIFTTNCKAEILDLDGKNVSTVDKSATKVRLAPRGVWRLKTTGSGWAWMGLGDYPVILCGYPELARKLNASRVVCADGTVVPLKFQERVNAWKKTLKPEDLKVEVADLAPLLDRFVADPESASMLGSTGALSAAEYLFSIQNVDPASPDFGRASDNIGALALLYSINKPWNPYYKNKAVLNRVALFYLNYLAFQFPLHENGTLYETHSNYAGADAMYSHQDCNAFALLAADLSPEVRDMWADGLSRPLLRFFSNRVSCENQSAHWPKKLHALYKGTGDAFYKTLAEDFVKDMNNPMFNRFIRTGYLQESYGPDATYQGLCTSVLAFYHLKSGDENALDVLKKIFNLMNHTVAPEPDGRTIYGSSGFSHRTMGSWAGRQYGGGTRLVADKLDDAACWHRAPEGKWGEADFKKWIDWSKNSSMDHYKRMPYYATNYSFAPFSGVWHSIPPVNVRAGAKFPVEKAESFDHRFTDEFLFSRRPGYYAGVYTGNTAGKHVSWGKNQAPHGSEWAETDGFMTAGKRAIFSALQGLQMFWTPKYGTAIVSMNWALYTHQTTRVQKNDGGVDWLSYWDAKSEHKPDENKLTLESKFLRSPVSAGRKLFFLNDHVKVELAFSVGGDMPDARLVEQFPHILKDGAKVEFQANGAWRPEPGGQVTAVRWTNSANAGAMISFETPVAVSLGKKYSDQGVRVGTLDVVVPGTLSKGSEIKFNYQISSF